jgi:hypothetical protein
MMIQGSGIHLVGKGKWRLMADSACWGTEVETKGMSVGIQKQINPLQNL